MTGGIVHATAGLCVLLLSLGGCDGADQPPRGGSVTVIEADGIVRPMPLISESALDAEFQAFMFRPLLQEWWEESELRYLTHDENPMALAHRWEYVEPDSSAIRFHLVTDARWSDGEPVTAHDVVWSIETRGDPRLAGPRQHYNDRIESVEADDDHTVTVRFSRRYPEMLYHTSGPVAPRHAFAEIDPGEIRTHPTMIEPAGNLPVSGAFMISRWERGQQVVLVPNPHFSPRPHLDRIVVRTVPEQTTRMVEFQTGRVDMMPGAPFFELDRLRREVPDARLERREGRDYGYVGYNPHRFAPFADLAVRRALGHAIDSPSLISALGMDGFARPAGGPYAPILGELHDAEAQAPLSYDPEKARRILAEAGFEPGPDGILRRQGTPFRFTLTINAGNQRRADVAQIVQQYLRRIGVDMRIESLETGTYVDRLVGGEPEAFKGSWEIGLSPDLTTILGRDAHLNLTRYRNPDVEALFEQALGQPTREAALPHWREAARLIAADQPYTWLYYMDEVVVVHDRLRGTTINTLGTYQNLWEWWVADPETEEG